MRMNEITEMVSSFQSSSAALENARASGGLVLVVDDEPAIHRALQRVLKSMQITIEGVLNSVEAEKALSEKKFDLIISDLHMSGGGGLALLDVLEEKGVTEPVIMMSGAPTVESAIAAVNHNVYSYLTKPFDVEELKSLVGNAIALSRQEKSKRPYGITLRKKSVITQQFEAALDSLWIAKQPIVNIRRSSVGFELLLRNEESSLKKPEGFWDCASELGREEELSEAISMRALELMDYHPHHTFFYNLHFSELGGNFFSRKANPLHKFANRVVLEISDRKEITSINLPEKVRRLREFGYRFAIDKFGLGGSDLEKLFQIQPEHIKFGRALTKNVHKRPENEKLIVRFVEICKEIRILVIAEGVESQEDFLKLKELGVEVFQGFLFGRPVG